MDPLKITAGQVAQIAAATSPANDPSERNRELVARVRELMGRIDITEVQKQELSDEGDYYLLRQGCHTMDGYRGLSIAEQQELREKEVELKERSYVLHTRLRVLDPIEREELKEMCAVLRGRFSDTRPIRSFGFDGIVPDDPCSIPFYWNYL